MIQNNRIEANQLLPLVAPLPSALTAVEAFLRLSQLPHVLFLDSNVGVGGLGRYSFVAADPFEWIEAQEGEINPLADLENRFRRYRGETHEGVPPFQGGLAGLFAYDLGRTLEQLPAPRRTDFPFPHLAVGIYDVVLAFDHELNQAWMISQGFPEMEFTARLQRAEDRMNHFLSWLEKPHQAFTLPPVDGSRKLAHQFDVGLGQITSNLSAADYLRMVEKAVEYIHAGDLFQVNLSQRLLCPARSSATDLYLRLREKNPAPYAGYFDQGDWQICSSSPECFLRIRDGVSETRPIKGTRGRSLSPEADLYTADDLKMSEKDRAENVMIVDLMRNDFSRVCTPESVHVSQLCEVETYAHVKHLVSSVRGQLRPGTSPLDLLRACFPGGSITGAPKIRAMEIIAELEPTARGAYCGSLGYIGFDGQMDSSILIRTITAGGGWWQFPVGGGIVAQSNPQEEYRETWHKARGLLNSLGLT